jgi:hypothetical protein
VNRVGHAAGLANTHTDTPTVIAHCCDDTESKAPTALNNIRHPRDIYDVFIQFFSIRHSASVPLELEPLLAGCFRKSLHTAVIPIPSAIKDHCFDSIVKRSLRYGLPYDSGLLSLRKPIELPLDLRIDSRSRSQRVAFPIVNDLSIDMLQTAEDV